MFARPIHRIERRFASSSANFDTISPATWAAGPLISVSLGICSPGYWRWRNPAIAAHPRVPHTLLAHHVQTMPILSAQRLVADYRFLLTSPTAVPIGFEVVRLSKLSFHRCLVFRNVGRSKATEPAPESLTRPRRGVSASLVWESWGSCRPPGSRLRW